MSFPNAQKGIKKIYIGELLMLISIVLTTVSDIALLIFSAPEEVSDATVGASVIGLVVFSVAASLLTVFALIFSIIGVIQTSKDEPLFKGVIAVMLLSVGVTVVSAIFTENQLVTKLTSVINEVSGTITIVLIVFGIGKMAEKLGNDDVFVRGQTLLRIIIWIALLSVIIKAVAAFAPYSVVLVLDIIMLIGTGVLEVVEYFLYLSFLNKTKKMLAQS